MTKEEFEKQLLEDILTGKVEEAVYGYIQDNLSILNMNKDYFRQYFISAPHYAYLYAKYVDKCSREDTREAACKNPHYAYRYARYVDNCPREDTRQGACKYFYYAYLYAKYIDKRPRDDTRLAACKDPPYAYMYAIYVDNCPREDTFNAVKGTEYEELYLRVIEKPS